MNAQSKRVIETSFKNILNGIPNKDVFALN
jgi:hypothetical protein